MAEYKLPQKWIKYLKSQPESGQGYQKADIYFKDRTLENIIILNCEVFKYKKNTKLDLGTIEKIVVK